MPIPEDEFERTIIISPDRAADPAPVQDVMGHYLLVGKDGDERSLVDLGTSGVTIGRDARQTLVLADTEVSRLHARITFVDGSVVVEDLNSTNGTYLDGQRLVGAATLKEGDVLRMGSHFLQYERRSQRDVERVRGLDRELQKASKYVLSLLPPPLTEGAVLAEWRFVPSAQLGGDAFGYYWLDSDTFVFYLIDVSGHGAGSAMHSVTVLNVLRQRALPQVDFQKPAEVLASLNNRFQMDDHGGLFFTMWYGVYKVGTRSLTFSSAGHHPAFLVPPDRATSRPLAIPAMMIGAMPDVEYETMVEAVPAGGAVYLFSDGVFEIETGAKQQWGISNFERLFREPPIPGVPEVERLYQAVKNVAGPRPLDDDASLVVVTFP